MTTVQKIITKIRSLNDADLEAMRVRGISDKTEAGELIAAACKSEQEMRAA